MSHSTIKLLSSYLTNRKFFVSVDGFLSDNKIIRAGVPQGAVLSPLLYNVYVSDIPTCDQVHMAQYADDTCLFYQLKFKHIPNYIHVLQTFLDKICDWFASWNIKINAQKTEAIVFTKTYRTVEAPIKISNTTIPYSSKVKYLGLTLDSKLTFKSHVNTTINNAYGALSILYPFFKSYTLSWRIKLILYMSIIRSMLLYGCEAWSILPQCNKKRVKIMQNKCLKIIFDAPRYTRMSDLHDVAQMPYIAELLDSYVHKMYTTSLTHENPLVQAMGHYNQQRAKHRNIFLGVQPDNTGIT